MDQVEIEIIGLQTMMNKMMKRMARMEGEIAALKHPQESNERKHCYDLHKEQYAPPCDMQ